MLTHSNCWVTVVALHWCIGGFTKQYAAGLGISANTVLPNLGMFGTRQLSITGMKPIEHTGKCSLCYCILGAASGCPCSEIRITSGIDELR